MGAYIPPQCHCILQHCMLTSYNTMHTTPLSLHTHRSHPTHPHGRSSSNSSLPPPRRHPHARRPTPPPAHQSHHAPPRPPTTCSPLISCHGGDAASGVWCRLHVVCVVHDAATRTCTAGVTPKGYVEKAGGGGRVSTPCWGDGRHPLCVYTCSVCGWLQV